MKKLLSFLVIGSILSTGSTNVIACNSSSGSDVTPVDPEYDAALVASVKDKIENVTGSIIARGYSIAFADTNTAKVSDPLTSNAIKEFLNLTEEESSILDISTTDSSDILTMNQIKELSYHIQAGASSETVLHDTEYLCDSSAFTNGKIVVAKTKWGNETFSVMATRTTPDGSGNTKSFLWTVDNATGAMSQKGGSIFSDADPKNITALAVYNDYLFVGTQHSGLYAFPKDFSTYYKVALTNEYDDISIKPNVQTTALMLLFDKLVIVSNSDFSNQYGGLYAVEVGSDKSFRENSSGLLININTRRLTQKTNNILQSNLQNAVIRSAVAGDDYLFIYSEEKNTLNSGSILALDLSSDIFAPTTTWTVVDGISWNNRVYAMTTKNGILYAAGINTLPSVGNGKSTLTYKMNIAAYHANNSTTFTKISTNLSIAEGAPIDASEVGYPTDLIVYDDSVYLSTTGSGLWRLESDDSWKSVTSFVYTDPTDTTSTKNFNIGYLFYWANGMSLSAGENKSFGSDFPVDNWSTLPNISFY